MPPPHSLAEVLAQASFHFSKARPLIPMYAHLILSALFPIYTGAHASLSRPSSAAKPDKNALARPEAEEDEDEEQIQKMEGLSNKDAILLPVTAGLVLAALYFLIMRYGADVINLVLGWYFSGVGIYSVAKLVKDGLAIVVGLVFPSYYADRGALWKVDGNKQEAVKQQAADTITRSSPLPSPTNRMPMPASVFTFLWQVRRFLKQKYNIEAFVRSIVDINAYVNLLDIVSALFGCGTIIYVNTVSKPWFLTNLQGFAVSYSALQLLSPTTFATGSLILGALFCYDIWAVFFTPLMVTVAKNLDQPIKLLFPRPEEPSETPGEPPVQSFSMLGLGDIVLPGIMIGLALRFDLYLYYLKKQKTSSKIVQDNSGKENTRQIVEKAPYVSVSGHWGDRFWTIGLPAASLPLQLQSSFPKPYFTASVVGYVIGMTTTLGVMSVFQHAQPALLYLVPGVLISLWGTSLVRGEVKDMWQFSEAVTTEPTDEEPKEDETSSAEAKASNHDNSHNSNNKGLFERLWTELWGADQSNDKSTESKPTDPAKSAESSKRKAGSNEEKSESDLLFSLSVSLHNPNKTGSDIKTDSSALKAKEGIPNQAPNTSSSRGPDSVSDGILVSPSDAEIKPKTVDSEPRYRTRSKGTD